MSSKLARILTVEQKDANLWDIRSIFAPVFATPVHPPSPYVNDVKKAAVLREAPTTKRSEVEREYDGCGVLP